MGTYTTIRRAGRHHPLFCRHVRHYDLRQRHVLHHQTYDPRGAEPLASERVKSLAVNHATDRFGAHTGAFAGNAVQLLLLLEESEGQLEAHGGAIRYTYCGLDHRLGDLPLREEPAWQRKRSVGLDLFDQGR